MRCFTTSGMTRNDKLRYGLVISCAKLIMRTRCQTNRESLISFSYSASSSEVRWGVTPLIRPRHGNSVDVARHGREGRSALLPGWSRTTFPFQFQTISYSAPARMIFSSGTLACKGCGKERKVVRRKEREKSTAGCNSNQPSVSVIILLETWVGTVKSRRLCVPDASECADAIATPRFRINGE